MAQPNTERSGAGAARPQPLLAPNWFLGMVPRQLWGKKKRFFIYEQDFLPLNGNASSSGIVQIQNDSHFLCVAGIVLVTDSTGVTIVNAPNTSNSTAKLVQIFDVASGAPLSSTALPAENFFGTAQLPAVWAVPYIFRAGSSIQVQVQNLSGTAHRVYCSFWGMRIYPAISQEQEWSDLNPATAS